MIARAGWLLITFVLFPGVLTVSVSRPAGSVTERRTATLETTRLPSCAVGSLSPSVGTSLPAAPESVWTTGEATLGSSSPLTSHPSLLAGCVTAGMTVKTSLTRRSV